MKNATVRGEGVKIFGLYGARSDKHWIVAAFKGGGSAVVDLYRNPEFAYINTEVDPAPVSKEILRVIEQDRGAGNLQKIAAVVVSSRVAVRLFLEGALTADHISQAIETSMDKRLPLLFSTTDAVEMGTTEKNQLFAFVPGAINIKTELTVPMVYNFKIGIDPASTSDDVDPCVHECIAIPTVSFGEVALPLIMMSERVVGTSFIATIDCLGNVV